MRTKKVHSHYTDAYMGKSDKSSPRHRKSGRHDVDKKRLKKK